MGGYGSGWQGRRRQTVEEALDLPSSILRGLRLDAASVSQWRSSRTKEVVGSVRLLLTASGVMVDYRAGGEPVLQLVKLTSTRPHLGGQRLWWVCPRCGGRKATVFVCGRAGVLCRVCAGLSYASSQSSGWRRAQLAEERARRRLDPEGEYGWLRDLPPPKPPGMHWATYERLEAEYWRRHREAEGLWLQGALRMLGW